MTARAEPKALLDVGSSIVRSSAPVAASNTYRTPPGASKRQDMNGARRKDLAVDDRYGGAEAEMMCGVGVDERAQQLAGLGVIEVDRARPLVVGLDAAGLLADRDEVAFDRDRVAEEMAGLRAREARAERAGVAVVDVRCAGREILGDRPDDEMPGVRGERVPIRVLGPLEYARDLVSHGRLPVRPRR